jgi:hypothetical protein
VANTKALSGDCRRGWRSVRTSSPRSGCAEGFAVLGSANVQGGGAAELEACLSVDTR